VIEQLLARSGGQPVGHNCHIEPADISSKGMMLQNHMMMRFDDTVASTQWYVSSGCRCMEEG